MLWEEKTASTDSEETVEEVKGLLDRPEPTERTSLLGK